MTAGAHDAGGGFGRSAGANAVRGVAVIAVAVIVGVILMIRGIDQNNTEAADADVTSESTDDTSVTEDTAGAGTETTDGTAAETTDDTTAESVVVAPVAHAPAEVKVLVLNGTNGIQGAAGRGRDAVVAGGYIGADPKDADVDGPSVIVYTEGYEADAIAIAELFGVDPATTVQALDPAAVPMIADTQGANVIVRVGNDNVIQV